MTTSKRIERTRELPAQLREQGRGEEEGMVTKVTKSKSDNEKGTTKSTINRKMPNKTVEIENSSQETQNRLFCQLKTSQI